MTYFTLQGFQRDSHGVTLGMGAVAVAHVLRVRDGLAIDNNRVHEILQEHEHVTENETKQGRRRPWVRWERDYSLVTVHMDWYRNDHDQRCLAVLDDASRKVLGMIEGGSRSAARSVSLLDGVIDDYTETGEILEVITDHGSAFYAQQRGDEESNHEFETYLAQNRIEHTLCAVGQPQSNGKIERFFQTYDKQRWRFGTLDEFLTFYNQERPHMSLNWDELETPDDAFDRLLPTADDGLAEALATGGDADD
jgi:transposase InsO family protein